MNDRIRSREEAERIAKRELAKGVRVVVDSACPPGEAFLLAYDPDDDLRPQPSDVYRITGLGRDNDEAPPPPPGEGDDGG